LSKKGDVDAVMRLSSDEDADEPSHDSVVPANGSQSPEKSFTGGRRGRGVPPRPRPRKCVSSMMNSSDPE